MQPCFPSRFYISPLFVAFSWRHCAGAVLAFCIALMSVGCDSNDEADREDFSTLAGEWRLSSFRIDGDTELVARINSQYASPVQFTFYSRDSENDRRFNIFARIDGQGENLDERGNIRIDGEDDEMDFLPDNPNLINFDVDYQILSEDRIILTTDDQDGVGLRNIFLPNSDVGGISPEVRVVITR